MSHSVTVRTTTTSTSTGYVYVGFFKTVPGILKVLETVVGGVVLGLTGYYATHRGDHRLVEFEAEPAHTYLFLVAFACLLSTFLLVVSSLISMISATLLPKAIFEFLFHIFACLLYLTASLALFIILARKRKYYGKSHEGKYAAASLGLVNAALYLVSAVFSYKSFKSA